MRQDGPSPLKIAGHTIHRDVLSSIQAASKQTGVSFAYLMAQAGKESDFKAVSQNKASSAAGLYQFTKGTWLQLLKESGAKYGYGDIADKITRTPKGDYVVNDPDARQTIFELRRDTDLSSLMAAEYALNNKARMERALKRPVTYTDLHLAHFLGPGGAVKLLRAREADAQAAAADVVPNAARQNPSIFYNKPDQTPRSIAGVYQKVHDSIDRPMRNFAGLENQDPASAVITVADNAESDEPRPRRAGRKAVQAAKAEVKTESKAERAAESMGDKLKRIAGQWMPGSSARTLLAEALIPSAKAEAVPAKPTPTVLAQADKPAPAVPPSGYGPEQAAGHLAGKLQRIAGQAVPDAAVRMARAVTTPQAPAPTVLAQAEASRPADPAVPPSGYGPEQAAGHLAERLQRIAGQAVPDAAVQMARAVATPQAPAPTVLAQAEASRPADPAQARQAAAGLADKAGRLAGKVLPDQAVLAAMAQPQKPEAPTLLAQAEAPRPADPAQARQAAAGLADKAGRLAGKVLPDQAVLAAMAQPQKPETPASAAAEEQPIILAQAMPPREARPALAGNAVTGQLQRIANRVASDGAILAAQAERTAREAAAPSRQPLPEPAAPEPRIAAAPPPPPATRPSLEEQFAAVDGEPALQAEQRVTVALRDDAESYDQISMPMPPRPADAGSPTYSPDPGDDEGALSKLFHNMRRTFMG